MKATIQITTEIKIPEIPNFLILTDGQKIPVSSVSQADLRKIGEEWILKALLKKAGKKPGNPGKPRRKKDINIGSPDSQNNAHQAESGANSEQEDTDSLIQPLYRCKAGHVFGEPKLGRNDIALCPECLTQDFSAIEDSAEKLKDK